jgi:hypothetical protein
MKRLVDRDLLTAFALSLVGGVAVTSAGDDVKNWVFPLLAAYLLLSIAAALVVRVILAAIRKNVPDIVWLAEKDRAAFVDVFVFFSIVLGYMFVMHGLGFWLASFIMLSLTSLWLTQDRTRRNIRLALVVPLCTCIVAYLVFLHLFYVPFPKATWWSGLT